MHIDGKAVHVLAAEENSGIPPTLALSLDRQAGAQSLNSLIMSQGPRWFHLGISIVLLIFILFSGACGGLSIPFEITEVREPCSDYNPLKQPFFGETHSHTSFSFDAYVFSVRNDPFDAYRFAKGEALPLPGALARGGVPQTRSIQLRRPLDFAAVTDHAELFGEMQVCTRNAPHSPGHDAVLCQQMRSGNPDPTLIALEWAFNPILREDGASPLRFCSDPGVDCVAATIGIWQDIQEAAEAHYDRSSECDFTTFVAYEYTAQPSFDNLHRNVIFRNADVPLQPVSNITTEGPFVNRLWQKLKEDCIDADSHCDVLTIPHNPNLSGENEADPSGRMFPDPRNVFEARQRSFFEPLVEIIQHKGASECRFSRQSQTGVQTTDEFCAFEQVIKNSLNPTAPDITIEGFPPRDMLRNALKDGMALAPSLEGVNPFKYGIVGSTDTHNGAPGSTVEPDFQGHAGTDDAPYANLLSGIYRGPGGLAVVWAEENSRDSLFSAMRRKEVYGTSGTRPVLRFFGGWNLETKGETLCNSPDMISLAYQNGVPMGSDLPTAPSGRNPRFLVAALKDAGSDSLSGTPLQRVQIVKGWVDAQGNTFEKVMDVAGNTALKGDELNTASCRANPEAGFNTLCTVWEDTEFDSSQRAFYYARILENPTCRWSVFACREAGVDPFAPAGACMAQAELANARAVADGEINPGSTPFNNCCLNENNNPFISRTIQERAWSSPIWYEPDI